MAYLFYERALTRGRLCPPVFFAALRKPKYRALFMTCYAAGLRLGERFPQYASRLKQQLELHQVLESTPSPAGAAHQR